MQRVGVVKPVMPSGCRKLLALRYFGVGIRFDEVRSSIGGEAKVDACVSIELQCAVDAFRCSLKAGGYLRRKVLGWPVYNSDAFLITGIVFDLFGGNLPCPLTAHAAEFQFPDRQNAQPIVAEHGDIELTSLDVLLGDGGSSEPLVNERDSLCELLVRIDDGCLRDAEGSILVQALDDQRQRKARRPFGGDRVPSVKGPCTAHGANQYCFASQQFSRRRPQFLIQVQKARQNQPCPLWVKTGSRGLAAGCLLQPQRTKPLAR